ncbi:unnamed protein product [Penicillium manginii]
MFYDDISVYPAFGGVVFAQQEGQRIAGYLGPKNKNMIMQNHGLLTSGTIGATTGGLKKTLVDHETALYTKKGTGSPEAMYMQFEPEYQLLLKESDGQFLE